MERETIRWLDRFANYETNRYPCPKCGNEFLVLVEQTDTYCCNQCEWTEGAFGVRPEDCEGFDIDYENPARETWHWWSEFRGFGAFYEHMNGEPWDPPPPRPGPYPYYPPKETNG